MDRTCFVKKKFYNKYLILVYYFCSNFPIEYLKTECPFFCFLHFFFEKGYDRRRQWSSVPCTRAQTVSACPSSAPESITVPWDTVFWGLCPVLGRLWNFLKIKKTKFMARCKCEPAAVFVSKPVKTRAQESPWAAVR